MKRKLTMVALLLCFSSLAYVKVISADTWAPGVVKGDFFYYEMYGVYTSNIPNSIIEVPSFERNTTDWVRIDITGVSGSIVSQIYTLHFKNGTETETSHRTDLDPSNSGKFNFAEKGVPICAANLEVDDQLSTVKLRISGTLVWTYPSGERRETNYVSWNFTEDWGHCYFDRKTGMLVELYRVHLFANSASGEVISKADIVNMIQTNRWEIKELSAATLLPEFIGIDAVALPLLAIAVHRHNSTSKSAHYTTEKIRIEKRKGLESTELHEDHFCS
jgi:hypothetical protein